MSHTTMSHTNIWHTVQTALATVLLLFVSGPACASDGLEGIGPVGGVKKLFTDFQFTEGPAADTQGNLYFTDIPANKIYQVTANGKLEVFIDGSNHANGLMVAGGDLYACEMDGQLAAYDLKTKKRRVVVAQYKGNRFNAPNDLVIDKQGGIYFTDPHFRAPMPLPQGKQAVYYVHGDKVARLIDPAARRR